MDVRITGLVLLSVSVVALSVAQILIKSRLNIHGVVPLDTGAWSYILSALRDFYLWFGAVGLIASSLCWYAAISRLPLSIAFPFAALSYPAVLAGSALVLRESVSWPLLAGNGLVVLGILVISLSSSN
jgi:drug/metabolite transporter (DMT)-like permease